MTLFLSSASADDFKLRVVLPNTPSGELTYTRAEINPAWYADHTEKKIVPSRIYLMQGENTQEITSRFPRWMRDLLGRASAIDPATGQGPNCLGAAVAFQTQTEVSYLSAEAFSSFAQKHMRALGAQERLEWGDILYFKDTEHAAVYLFDGLVFQKPSVGSFHTYEIVAYPQVYETLNRSIAMARRTHAAGAARASHWDVFMAGIAQATPLSQPLPLEHNPHLVRLRSTSCGGLLKQI